MMSRTHHHRGIFVVNGGDTGSVRQNRTIFYDQKFGSANGQVENAGKKFKDIPQSPIYTDGSNDWDAFVLQLSPGSYTMPKDLQLRPPADPGLASLVVKGTNADSSHLIFNGFDNTDPTVSVVFEDLTIYGGVMTLNNTFYFRNCTINTAIELTQGARAVFESCDIVIQGTGACILAPVFSIPPDPFNTPVMFFDCEVVLTGQLLARGATFRNCDLIQLDASAGEIAFAYSSFSACNINELIGGSLYGFYGVFMKDTHAFAIAMQNGTPESPNGGTCFIQSIVSNCQLDLLFAGSGIGSGNGGDVFAYTNLQNNYFLAMASGEGGSGETPGNAGRIFFNCFNMTNNYIEFQMIVGSPGRSGDGRMGEGGAVVFVDQDNCNITGLMCDLSVEVGEFGSVVRNFNHSLTMTNIYMRNILMLQGGKILHTSGIDGQVHWNGFTSEYVEIIDNEDQPRDNVLFYADVEEDSNNLRDFGLTIAILTVIGAVIGLTTTLVEKYGATKTRSSLLGQVPGNLALSRVDRTGSGSHIIQNILSSVSVNRMSAPQITILEARTPNSVVKGDNIAIRNVRSSIFSSATGANRGRVEMSNSLVEDAEFVEQLDSLTIHRRRREEIQRSFEKKLNKQPLHVQERLRKAFRVSTRSPDSAVSLEPRSSIFNAVAGGDVVISNYTMTRVTTTGPLTIANSTGESDTVQQNILPGTRAKKSPTKTRVNGKRVGQGTPSRLRLSTITTQGIEIRVPPESNIKGTFANGTPRVRQTTEFALYTSNEGARAFYDSISMENTVVESPKRFVVIEGDSDAQIQCAQFQLRELDYQQTPPTSRILLSVNNSNLQLAHTKLQEYAPSAPLQIEHDGASILAIQHVYVDNPAGGPAGQYTSEVYSEWNGTSQG